METSMCYKVRTFLTQSARWSIWNLTEKNPIAVQIPLSWVLSGPLPFTSVLVSTCFKPVTQSESDSKLADQFRSWYETESLAAMKQVDPRFEVRNFCKKQHIMTDADIKSVCCGLTTRVVYKTTFQS